MQKLYFTKLTIILTTVPLYLSGMDTNNRNNHKIQQQSISHQQKRINSFLQNEYEKTKAQKQQAQILMFLNEKAHTEKTTLLPKNMWPFSCTLL